jgi:hypothetical protein
VPSTPERFCYFLNEISGCVRNRVGLLCYLYDYLAFHPDLWYASDTEEERAYLRHGTNAMPKRKHKKSRRQRTPRSQTNRAQSSILPTQEPEKNIQASTNLSEKTSQQARGHFDQNSIAMDSTDVKKIRKEIGERLRSRESFLVKKNNRSWLIAHRTILICAFYWALLFGLNLKDNLTIKNSAERISLALFTNAFLLMYAAGKIRSSEPPNDEKKKDQWLWEQQRSYFLCYSMAITFFTLGLPFYSDINRAVSFTFAIGWVGYFLYALTILLVLWKPRFFLSNFLGGIGSGGKVFFGVALIIFMFAAIVSSKDFISIAFAVFFCQLQLKSLVPWVAGAIKKITPRRELNLVQIAVTEIIQPERLLQALRLHSEIIRDRIKALEIIAGLEEANSYGVKIALAEILAKENSSKVLILLAMLTSLLLFILAAVGEAFFQDLLYDSLLKPLLCKFNTSFCK